MDNAEPSQFIAWKSASLHDHWHQVLLSLRIDVDQHCKEIELETRGNKQQDKMSILKATVSEEKETNNQKNCVALLEASLIQ